MLSVHGSRTGGLIIIALLGIAPLASAQMPDGGWRAASCSDKSACGRTDCQKCSQRQKLLLESRYIKQHCQPTIAPGSCFGYFPTKWSTWDAACPQWQTADKEPTPSVVVVPPKSVTMPVIGTTAKPPEEAPPPRGTSIEMPAPRPVKPEPKPVVKPQARPEAKPDPVPLPTLTVPKVELPLPAPTPTSTPVPTLTVPQMELSVPPLPTPTPTPTPGVGLPKLPLPPIPEVNLAPWPPVPEIKLSAGSSR